MIYLAAFWMTLPVEDTSLPKPLTVPQPSKRNTVEMRKQTIAIFFLFFMMILSYSYKFKDGYIFKSLKKSLV